jgi:hypothetical protein
VCDDAGQRASIHTDEHKQPAAVLRDQGKYGQAGEMYRQAIGLSEDLKTKPSMRRA